MFSWSAKTGVVQGWLLHSCESETLPFLYWAPKDDRSLEPAAVTLISQASPLELLAQNRSPGAQL